MNKIKAKFGKRQEPTPLASATKDFIKGGGDEGLQCLPFILESCSSAAEFSLTAQIEVLDIVTKYYSQHQSLMRQLRCIDLLRYLSDQQDNELFQILSQGHPLLKAIDNHLKNTRSQVALQKSTRVLLDHLVRQPNVPDAVVELHAKHVNGFNKPHKPTIILSDQEVVADDIEAGSAESELLATLLTEGNADESLVEEVYRRVNNTRERLVRDIETSTNEAQTVNLLETVEKVDRVLLIYREVQTGTTLTTRLSTAESQNSSMYQAPSRSMTENASQSRPSSSSRSGKGKALDEEPEPIFQTQYGDFSSLAPTRDEDDNFGEGSSRQGGSSRQSFHDDERTNGYRSDQTKLGQDIPGMTQSTSMHSELSSNNPFAPKSPKSDRVLSSSNPFATRIGSPPLSSKNPFGDHSQ